MNRVDFIVQYLGSTSVTKTHGTGSTDDAVRTIVQDVSHCIMILHNDDVMMISDDHRMLISVVNRELNMYTKED